MKRQKKEECYCPPTMMLGGHTVATATGYCVPDCRSCLRSERMAEYMWVGFILLLVVGALCGNCQ